jgi:hypothetical protein
MRKKFVFGRTIQCLFLVNNPEIRIIDLNSSGVCKFTLNGFFFFFYSIGIFPKW